MAYYNEEFLVHLLDTHDGIFVRYHMNLRRQTIIQIDSGDDIEGTGNRFEDALEDCLKNSCQNHEDGCLEKDYDDETNVTEWLCGYECHDFLGNL